MNQGKIAVIGGANMDIGGFVSDRLRMRDSNIGTVRLSPGGVGRNIAENAARLGLQTEFVGAIGGDANGKILLEDCREKGIGTAHCLVSEEDRTSVYLFIDDEHGDMCVAVNDMAIQSRLTPAFFEDKLPWLNTLSAVILDANLPGESLAYLAREVHVPLIADAVSVAKAPRLESALPGLYAIKPNRYEAEVLTGIAVTNMQSALDAANALLDRGVQRVYLTMGPQGALCAEQGRAYFVPTLTHEIANATGAGDAFTAAIAWAQVNGCSFADSARAGVAAAAIATAAAESVSPYMCADVVFRNMANIKIDEIGF